MSDEKKDQRVTFMMSVSELQRLDDWAFEARIRSRGEAIRRLIADAAAIPRSSAQTVKPKSDFAAGESGNKT